MKFAIALLTLFYLIDIVAVFSVTSAQNWNEWFQSFRNQQKRSQTNCRFPLFNCRLINKFRSTKRQTPLNSAVPGEYGQPSSVYPSYEMPYSGSMTIPGNLLPDQFASASNAYPMAAPPDLQQTQFIPTGHYTAQNYGQSPNTIDVHQVLDEFVRSAGLSPQGDHQAAASHASSFAKAGTTPVFVFKKLFSFPFYLSSNPEVVDLYGKGWK